MVAAGIPIAKIQNQHEGLRVLRGEASTAAWLRLRDEGGLWTVRELEDELQCFTHAELQRSLKNLVNRQHLRQRNLKTRVVYGVTFS